MDDEKLMPCPFCGGEVTLRDEVDCWSFTCPKETDCRKNTAIYLAGHPSKEDAIKWWNTRAC